MAESERADRITGGHYHRTAIPPLTYLRANGNNKAVAVENVTRLPLLSGR